MGHDTPVTFHLRTCGCSRRTQSAVHTGTVPSLAMMNFLTMLVQVSRKRKYSKLLLEPTSECLTSGRLFSSFAVLRWLRQVSRSLNFSLSSMSHVVLSVSGREAAPARIAIYGSCAARADVDAEAWLSCRPARR